MCVCVCVCVCVCMCMCLCTYVYICIATHLSPYPLSTCYTANETDDPDCIVRCVPVVAYYTGHPDMLSKAEDCINLMQEFDITVATALLACRIMEQFILNDDSSLPVEKVLEAVVQELENPKRVSPHPLDKALLTHTREVLATDRTMVNYLACKKFGIA